MEIFRDIPSLRGYIASARLSQRVVLVPTMGALHDGHRACIDLALAQPEALVVISIFVNPAQFGPGEDFRSYPRPLDADLDCCRRWGVHVVFSPAVEAMYPDGPGSWVDVKGIVDPLCGAGRPGHFRGVATVVAKLFNIVAPQAAVFGQKDAQQALMIRAMIRHLNFPVALRVARTAREPDGLAMSSRNTHLSRDERQQASAIHRSFLGARELVAGGERSARSVEASVRQQLCAGGIGDIEYAEVRDAGDLSALERIEGRAILAVAARVGATRLIDNVVFDVSGGAVDWDVDLL